MTANPFPPVHVVILAQGEQRRLPELRLPKQLLTLPECNGETIIDRTLSQLAMLHPHVTSEGIKYVSQLSITVVCANELAYHVEAAGKSGIYNSTGRVVSVDAYPLRLPGNSSLKGIARYLADQAGPISSHEDFLTVVLLGDVVYSWACLRAILTPAHWGMGFVGTSDLSRSGGELWGLAWKPNARPAMMGTLRAALARHPPFEEYQPGQMRRWLWEVDTFIHGGGNIDVAAADPMPRTWYTAIDDYTRDIDLPEHVNSLHKLSELANADDKANGLIWWSRGAE